MVRRGAAAASETRSRDADRRPHLPSDRDRRVGSGGDPGRGDAPPRRPGGRDVCPGRGRRRQGQRGRAG